MKSLRTSSLLLSLPALALLAGCGSAAPPPPDTPVAQVQTTNAAVTPEPAADPAMSPVATRLSTSSVTSTVTTPPPNGNAGTLSAFTGPSGTPAGANAKDMSDAQIAAVLQTAIEGQLAQARLAAKKTKDARALNLANRIASDQGKAGADLTAFQARHPMVAEGSLATADLQSENTKTLATLRGSRGLVFDQAYVDAQVTETARFLTLLDTTLIPSADDPELKSELTSVRAMVAAHAKLAQDAHDAYANQTGSSP